MRPRNPLGPFWSICLLAQTLRERVHILRDSRYANVDLSSTLSGVSKGRLGDGTVLANGGTKNALNAPPRRARRFHRLGGSDAQASSHIQSGSRSRGGFLGLRG